MDVRRKNKKQKTNLTETDKKKIEGKKFQEDKDMKKNTLKKALVMTMAAALGALALGMTGAKEVKAQECYFYDYNDMVPVEVWQNGVKTIEYRPRAYTFNQMQQNLQLLDNINRIQDAELAAKEALEIANGTLAQINNLQTAIAGKQQEVAVNPGLQPQLDELNAQLNVLTNQYNAQMADYQAKQAEFTTLQATLPTAGYNPNMCNALYGKPQNK